MRALPSMIATTVVLLLALASCGAAAALRPQGGAGGGASGGAGSSASSGHKFTKVAEYPLGRPIATARSEIGSLPQTTAQGKMYYSMQSNSTVVAIDLESGNVTFSVQVGPSNKRIVMAASTSGYFMASGFRFSSGFDPEGNPTFNYGLHSNAYLFSMGHYTTVFDMTYRALSNDLDSVVYFNGYVKLYQPSAINIKKGTQRQLVPTGTSSQAISNCHFVSSNLSLPIAACVNLSASAEGSIQYYNWQTLKVEWQINNNNGYLGQDSTYYYMRNFLGGGGGQQARPESGEYLTSTNLKAYKKDGSLKQPAFTIQHLNGVGVGLGVNLGHRYISPVSQGDLVYVLHGAKTYNGYPGGVNLTVFDVSTPSTPTIKKVVQFSGVQVVQSGENVVSWQGGFFEVVTFPHGAHCTANITNAGSPTEVTPIGGSSGLVLGVWGHKMEVRNLAGHVVFHKTLNNTAASKTGTVPNSYIWESARKVVLTNDDKVEVFKY